MPKPEFESHCGGIRVTVIRPNEKTGLLHISHCLELDDLEDLPAFARAVLGEDCSRTFIGKIQPYDHNQQNWRNYKKDDNRDSYIK